MHYFLKYLLFTFAITLSVNCFAVKKYDGTIYYENETVSVKFYIPIRAFSGKINYSKIQKHISYFDQENKLQKLYADEAVEYSFEYKGELIRMISQTYATEDQSKLGAYSYSIFYKLEIEDKLRVYSRENDLTIPVFSLLSGYTIVNLFGIKITNHKFFFEKSDGSFTRIDKVRFKKYLPEYFSDCKELALKIEQKIFIYKDIFKIAEFYNNNCN